MAITAYEIIDGNHVEVPPTGGEPSSGVASGDDQARNGTGSHGATDASPAGEQLTPEPSPAQTPSGGEGESSPDTDDDEPLRDDSEITAARLERRFKRLTAARRQAERERDALAQQHQVELAQTRGQLEVMQRMLSGAAPPLPETPAPPTGPPQAEQYASHEEYVLAAARYGAQQELQARDAQTAQERQRQQQAAFQQQLIEREAAFKQAHADFDERVRRGLAGKVSPIVQQALMLLPEGPAVAYALATQPELVQRLNTLPPPLVFAELGRLSPPPTPTPPANGTPTPAPTGSAPLDRGPGQASSPAQQLPEPLTPLAGSGAGTPTGSYHDGMSAQEYRAWRKRTSEIPTWKER